MKTKGQSVLEYALLITIVTIALIAMQRYLSNSVYSNVKVLSEQANVRPH
ncbi:MAG: hypothetical protein AB1629_04925 [Candidatus Omnitrophota bacterium]